VNCSKEVWPDILLADGSIVERIREVSVHESVHMFSTGGWDGQQGPSV
jgi:hypothetical protein